MPRESYHAPIGNTMDTSKLPPQTGAVFEQPLDCDGRIWPIFVLLLILGAIASFVIWVVTHSPAPNPAYMFNTPIIRVLCITALVCLIWQLVRGAPWFWLCVTAGVFPVLFFGGPALLIAAAVMVLAVNAQFVEHCRHIMSAAPCDRTKALAFREETWKRSWELAFIGVVAAFCMHAGAWAFIFPLQLLVMRLTNHSSDAFYALRLWFFYPDTKLPGVCRAPLGPPALRLALTAGLVVAVAGANVLTPDLFPVSQALFLAALADLGVEFTLTPFLHTAYVAAMLAQPVCVVFSALLFTAMLAWRDIKEFREGALLNTFEYSKALQHSPNPTERESIYLANVAEDNSPVLVPKSLFQEPSIIAGPAGSGKTATLGHLLEQLAQHPCSVVVIDNKADDNYLLETAKATGRKVRYFTTRNGRRTTPFNPFKQRFWREASIIERAEYLCDMLGLTYGADYGEGHFGTSHGVTCYVAVRDHEIGSFADCHRAVMDVITNGKKDEITSKVRQDAGTLGAKLLLLSGVETITSTEKPSADVAELFERPTVWHWSLPAIGGGTVNPDIGRSLLYAVLAEAGRRGPLNRPWPIYFFLEEFSNMVAKNLERIFEQARSMGAAIILSSQGMSNLRTRHTDLTAVLMQNTRLRWWFGAGDIHLIEEICRTSGETVDTIESVSRTSGTNGGSVTRTQTQFIGPRLNINEIIRITDDPRLSTLQITRGEGFAQFCGYPIVVRTEFHISKAEYERRRRAPWPGKDDEDDDTILLGAAPPKPRPEPPVIHTERIPRRPSSPATAGE